MKNREAAINYTNLQPYEQISGLVLDVITERNEVITKLNRLHARLIESLMKPGRSEETIAALNEILELAIK